MLLSKRTARMGSIAMLILLSSIILFIGSLFYLLVEGPWVAGGNPLFKPANYIENTPPQETITEMSLEEAIADLEESGCTVYKYEKTMDISTAQRLEYTEFKEKAIKNNGILVVQNKTGDPCLIILHNKGKYLWAP